MDTYGIDEYAGSLNRTCESCGRSYTIGEYLESSENYFPRPFDYRAGCERYCLHCWLVPDSEDVPGDQGPDDSGQSAGDEGVSLSATWDNGEDEGWPYDEVYPDLVDGHLIPAYAWFFEKGARLAVLPISRTQVARPTFFPGGIAFYPAGHLDLDPLGLVPNREDTNSLAERCSFASGVTAEVLNRHPLIVVPCMLDWGGFRNASHRSHLELIRSLSEAIDQRCLDFIRYRLCRIEPIDALPGRAGQISSNSMMAGMLLYNHDERESWIVGGAAFTHVLTQGLGLPLQQLEWNDFPSDGEVGHIVEHALSLYTALLEASNPTARFMQALSLLEFLAYPDEYKKFEEVKKVIARYVARDRTQYQQLLDRFFELTGKKNPDTGRIIGYRTRVVHMGERLERLVPDFEARKQLFLELDGYIRSVIDHMIEHSEKSFEDYLRVRDTLRPFEN